MAALRRTRRLARRAARKYQVMLLAVVVLCIVVFYAVTLDCTGCPEEGEAGARRMFDVEDQFTVEQRRHGAVLLHCIGLLYMFAGIAIVCDECFVPALEVITETLDITPDVAGATFMAAGGSAPEFFTSLIGSMITESDVGTGTIIGSAVFNVLFVIGSCALVAPSALELTWFPLARDSIFYAVDLIVVTCVFLDEKVVWYEALILFLLYICYTTFMYYSSRVEAWAIAKVEGASENEEEDKSWASSRDKSEDIDVGATAGTGDTGEEHHHPAAPPEKKNTFMRSSSSISVGDSHKKFRHHSMRATTQANTVKHLDTGSTGGSGDIVLPAGEQHTDVVAVAVPEAVPEDMPVPDGQQMELTNVVPAMSDAPAPAAKHPKNNQKLEEVEDEDENKEDDEDDDKPLSFYPPEDGNKKDMVYWVLTVPIVFILVLTVPDVRRDGWRKYYPLTFVMSILWIAMFTWAMVWFCGVIGTTAGISDSILGMTIIAAGTSVPDMLTSMIVAREGHGDMAVSSSIGSNIFDVTVGLPVPWLIFNAVKGRHVTIVNTGLEISVMILLAMLGITIGTIMCHGWSMTRMMGASMMVLYIVFQGVAIGLFIYTENGGSLKIIHV
mmetsp:Transcript_45480/g.131677  ORF Transcript_45480/g.131677 Transcript_45480/m.131677 type:complete len:611 (-) Transcript_45480:215-2047(-)